MSTKSKKPWEERSAQNYFPLRAKGAELFADSGTMFIGKIRGYLGEDELLAAEIAERCNKARPLAQKFRLLTRQDITVRQIDGYYIKLIIEYWPLGLRRCVDLRVWKQAVADGKSEEQAVDEALEFFNAEVARIHAHTARLLCP